MRKTADRLRAELSSRGGETLVETVISLLIFTVVMLAVTYMLTTSLRLVNKAQETARHLAAGIEAATVDAIFDEGLHEFLTRYIAEAATLANAIHDSYLSGEMR